MLGQELRKNSGFFGGRRPVIRSTGQAINWRPACLSVYQSVYLSVYPPTWLPARTLPVYSLCEQSSTRLGRPSAKASELVPGFGGVALEGALKGGVGFFPVQHF